MSNYLDYSDILSYDKPLNFVVTIRGWGKTYGFKKMSIKRFLKDGKQSVYARRYKDDFIDIKEYYTQVAAEFPECLFKVEAMKGYICRDPQEDEKDNVWEVQTFFIPLSRWQKLKGAEYVNVVYYCYDEFIKEDDTSFYLKNEPRALQNTLHTIFRNRKEGRAFLLGNLSTVLNPMFLAYKIHINPKDKVIRGKNYLVYLKKDDAFIAEARDSFVGAIIEGTDYEEFAMSNTPYMDSMAYVRKFPKDARNVLLIMINGNVYGLWKSDAGHWLSAKHNPTVKDRVSVDLDEKDDNFTFVNSCRANKHLMMMGMSFKNNLLFVDSMKIRDDFVEMLLKLKVYT